MSRLARVGAFVFVALLMLFGGIFLIGDQQFLFSRTYRIWAPFDNVAGLANGAEVRVGGVRKGTVDHIRMPQSPTEKMLVAVDLEKSTDKVVKKDSQASIETEGLLGNKYLAISFGSDKGQPIRDGDTITSVPPQELSDIIKKVNTMMDTANLALKNVDGATANVKSITEKINRGEGTVGALINDRQVYNQVSAATVDVRETVAQAKVGVTAFQENMQALKQNWFFRGFFNDRGYQDSTELTAHQIAKLPEGPFARKFIYDEGLFDKPDSAKLKNEKALNQVGEYLEKNPFSLAVIVGYLGQTGDKQENLVLSQARAMVVRKHLVENFKMDDSKIKTSGMGEAEKPSEDGKLSRIEIVVYSQGATPPKAAPTTGPAKPAAQPSAPPEKRATPPPPPATVPPSTAQPPTKPPPV